MWEWVECVRGGWSMWGCVEQVVIVRVFGGGWVVGAMQEERAEGIVGGVL